MIIYTEKVQEIIAAAMEATQAGKAHVFVSYSPHVNGLTIYAFPTGTAYQSMNGVLLFGSMVNQIYLEWDDAADKLDEILTKIKEL